MGGRSARSGFSSISKATEPQVQKINNIKKALVKRGESVSAPVFKRDKDGIISFKYTESRIIHKEKGGKMSSPEKADIYERVTTKTGRIMKDGLILKNKDVSVDNLIKKGRMPKR